MQETTRPNTDGQSEKSTGGVEGCACGQTIDKKNFGCTSNGSTGSNILLQGGAGGVIPSPVCVRVVCKQVRGVSNRVGYTTVRYGVYDGQIYPHQRTARARCM